MDSFFTIYVLPALIILLKSVVLIVILLVGVAFILYGDRKIFAGVQQRKGPNVVGPFGLLQSFADLGKFLTPAEGSSVSSGGAVGRCSRAEGSAAPEAPRVMGLTSSGNHLKMLT